MEAADRSEVSEINSWITWNLENFVFSSSAGRYRRSVKRLANGDLPPLEHLNLPPTKLEKKRIKLKRMYEKAILKQRPKTSIESNRLKPDDLDSPDRRRKSDNQVSKDSWNWNPDPGQFSIFQIITSYERNRLNNLKSHIALPTATSTISSTNSGAADIENDKAEVEIFIEKPAEDESGAPQEKSQNDDSKNSKEVQTDFANSSSRRKEKFVAPSSPRKSWR